MTLTALTAIANNYTDENYGTSLTMGFANTAISRINVELGAELPFFASADTAYTALSDNWVHMIVIPYVCWSIKMNDSALNEAQNYFITFEQGMRLLKRNKRTAIDTAYQGDSFTNSYTIDRYDGISSTIIKETDPWNT